MKSQVEIEWRRNGAIFTDLKYSRTHAWRFDGGVELRASSSPDIVPTPYSEISAVDPEEAFVASLASCHMLWFLSLAAGRQWVIESYRDQAEGWLLPDESGKLWVARVELRPAVKIGAASEVDLAALVALHERAHDECFLAKSVRTAIHCHPRFD